MLLRDADAREIMGTCIQRNKALRWQSGLVNSWRVGQGATNQSASRVGNVITGRQTCEHT